MSLVSDDEICRKSIDNTKRDDARNRRKDGAALDDADTLELERTHKVRYPKP